MSQQFNGLAELPSGKVRKACEAWLEERGKSIAAERESMIRQQVAKKRYRFLWFGAYYLTREQAIEALKVEPFGWWSPWDEPLHRGRVWRNLVVELQEAAVVLNDYEKTMYLTTEALALLKDYL